MKTARKFLAAILAVVMIICMLPATVVASSEQSHKDLAREAVGEGLVLLKNEGALPLNSDNTIALFGGGQVYTASQSTGYQIGGGGSGWVSMKSGYKPLGPADALLEAAEDGEVNVYEPLTAAYKANVNYVPDEAMYDAAAEAADTAIMFMTRFSKEGSDIATSEWYLSDAEKTMMTELSARFDNVIVLVNAPSVIGTNWSLEGDTEGIDIEGLLITYMAGEMGGYGIADVLLGRVNPSGKLVDTYAYDINDYSTTETFSESRSYVRYTEDIYVGYRYFETFAKDKVVYPFGYGLSYTTFDIKAGEVTNDGTNIIVPVTVTNTGDVAGKEVVQVYYSAPQKGEGSAVLSKSAIDLAAYAKTDLLAAGESQTLEITYAIADMASFDDTGISGHESCYVLEAGVYDILVGNSVRAASKAGEYALTALTVTEELSEMVPSNLDVRLTADGTYEDLGAADGLSTKVIVAENEATAFEAEVAYAATGNIATEPYEEEEGWLTDGSRWYNIGSGTIIGTFQTSPNAYIYYDLTVEEAGTYDIGFVTCNGATQGVTAEDIFGIEVSADGGETWTPSSFLVDSFNTRSAATATGYNWWNMQYVTADSEGKTFAVELPAGEVLMRVAITDNVAAGYSNTNLDKIILVPEDVEFGLADVFALYDTEMITDPTIDISATEPTWFSSEMYSALGGTARTEAYVTGEGYLDVGTGWIAIKPEVVVGKFSDKNKEAYVEYTVNAEVAGTYRLGMIIGNGDGSKLNGGYPDVADAMNILVSSDGGETFVQQANNVDCLHTRYASAKYYWNLYYSDAGFDGVAYTVELPAGKSIIRFANNTNTYDYCSINFDNFVVMPEGTNVTLDDVIKYYGVEDLVYLATLDINEDYYKGIKYEDVEAGEATIEEFVAQMSIVEMIDLTYGHLKGVRSGQGTIGFSDNATAEKYGVYSADTVDGPAGVDTGVYYSTYWPCTTLQACTWNEELLEEIGETVGQEALVSMCDIWLAPGMNIHRSPLCGRNFEYYSEDPLVTGKMAAAVTRGVQSQGVAVAAKHYAVNSKETNRKNSDSRVSEKALREIYLKGFEICVKEANPITIMSSYNLINGYHASNNDDLLAILRTEWGWDGLIMTDWNTTPGVVDEVNSGNNVTMPTGEPEQHAAAALSGELTRETLEQNTIYIVNALAKMPDYTINRLKVHNVSSEDTTVIPFTEFSHKSYHTYFERVNNTDMQCTSYIDLEVVEGDGEFGFHEFTVNVDKPGYYNLSLEYAKNSGALNNAFDVILNGKNLSNVDDDVPGTGAWTTFKTEFVGEIYLCGGKNVIRFQHTSDTGLNYLTMKLEAERLIGGDVDGDGALTNIDVITIARYIVRLVELDAEQLEAADCNFDGKVNSADVVVLARAIVGMV